MGGGDLALGVADHGRGLDPAGRQSAGQGDHHREERGLDDVEALEPAGARALRAGPRAGTNRRRARAPPRSASSRPAKTRRLAPASSTAIRGTGSPGRGRGRPAAAPCRRLPRTRLAASPCGEASRPLSSSSRSAATTDGALLEAGAGGGQRVGDVGGSSSGSSRSVAARRAAASAQGGSAPWPRGRRAGSGRSGEPLGVPPALGRSSGAGASSRITWALVPLMPKEETPARRGRSSRPTGGLGQQLDLARLPVDLARSARRRAGSSAGRPRRSASDHLDHPGDPGRGLGVADVGLDRAEPQRRLARPGRRWRAGRRPRSGRRGWCRCRGPRPRRPRRAAGGRWPAPGGSPAPGRGRWGR